MRKILIAVILFGLLSLSSSAYNSGGLNGGFNKPCYHSPGFNGSGNCGAGTGNGTGGGGGGGGIPNNAMTFNGRYMLFNGSYMTFTHS